MCLICPSKIPPFQLTTETKHAQKASGYTTTAAVPDVFALRPGRESTTESQDLTHSNLTEVSEKAVAAQESN